MAASDVIVRVQELGGKWQAIGTEKSRGIWVDQDSLSATADLWGSSQLQTQVRYDPRVLQPHLAAFTPTDLEIGGIPCWDGRVNETPSQDGDDRSISPSCEGWQFHLDDDAYQLNYVHSNLTDWQDAKQGLLTDLSASDYAASASVSTDQQGLPVIAIPQGMVVVPGVRVGIYLDLGPDTTAAVVSVDWQSSNNDSSSELLCRAMNTPQFGTQDTTYGFSDAWSIGSVLNFGAGASGTATGAFATPGRYVVLFMNQTTGFTSGGDIWWKFPGIRVFAKSAYQSSGQSILVGSTIAKDAVARATTLLSADMSQVAATTFPIPEFAMSDYQTARASITAGLAFDDVLPRILLNRLLSIRQRPTLPIYEVGEWAGAQFQDASTNSGDQIYSSVVVSGTDATGAPVKVRRNQVPTYFTPSQIQPSNPSATTNLTGWSSLVGTFTRDTVVFDTTPASFKVTDTGGVVELETSAWTGGTFVPGQTYQLRFRYQATSGFLVTISLADANGTTLATLAAGGPGAVWTTGTLTFVPQTSGSPRFTITQSVFPGTATINVDTLSLSQGAATLADQRGFRKTALLPTNMSLTPLSAAAIGDIFLAGHLTTPFKGTLNLNGPGAVRRIRGGQSVTMSELLQNTGELICFSHLIDPDTGGIGRYGRIASASLSGAFTGQVQIDSTRDNFQDFLNRIQVQTAQVH